jgi:hypothetical protein
MKIVVNQQLLKFDLREPKEFTWEGMRANSFLSCTEWSSIDLVQPASDAERGSGGDAACLPLFTEEAHAHKMSRGHITLRWTRLLQLYINVVYIPTQWRPKSSTDMASFQDQDHHVIVSQHPLPRSRSAFDRFADLNLKQIMLKDVFLIRSHWVMKTEHNFNVQAEFRRSRVNASSEYNTA